MGARHSDFKTCGLIRKIHAYNSLMWTVIA